MIDEAHCICKGPGFREDYLPHPRLRAEPPDASGGWCIHGNRHADPLSGTSSKSWASRTRMLFAVV